MRLRYLLPFALLVTPAFGQTSQPPTAQQVAEQREALQMGALLKQNIALSAQLEIANDALAKATARIKELEAKLPPEKP